MKLKLLLASAALTLVACGGEQPASDTGGETPTTETSATTTDAPEAPEAVAEVEPNDYTDVANWLCHPDKADDACAVDLTTTIVAPDASLAIEEYAAAEDPAIDCFYVYPTVSNDPEPNSDMIINDEELNVIEQQFARFGSVCRLYAPLYRQVTLTHLREFMVTGEFKAHPTLNYDDVVDAWETYLETENDGRGVIILGHSQGSGLVSRMAAEKLAGSDVMDRVISVMPIGTNVYPGEDGEYALPPCETSNDTGCMVAYVSFRGDREPPEDSRFGKLTEAGGEAMCTNPALISGDDGELHAYLAQRAFASGVQKPFAEGAEVTTPFASLPGMLTAECRSNDTHTWLAVNINGDPDDPRADDIAGDVVIAGQVAEDWGFHLIDMNVAMGNLIDIARAQGEAWLAAQ